MQFEFVPLRIIEYKPKPFQSTAHQSGIAQCEDGLRYFVKGINGDSEVCATEWVCTSFAKSLNLPVPPIKILQAPTGELAFGSQALTNCMPDVEASMLLLDGPGNLNVPELRKVLSATYAFDQLVSNCDRHDRNFLIQKMGVVDGQELANIQLIDFGNATLLNSDQPLDVLADKSHTGLYGRKFRNAHGFSLEAADSLLDRFKSGRSLMLKNAMLGLPQEWMSNDAREMLMDRVMSADFGRRMDDLREGLVDGTYL